jgi:hypothetical protein
VEKDGMIGATPFWERVKTTVRGDEKAGSKLWTILLKPLKAAIAEIAAAKSSRQFGREEEKE